MLTHQQAKKGFAIVRVWKSKMQSGEEATDAPTAYLDGGNVGHVSLQLFQNGRQKLYVSFWPSISPKSPHTSVDGTMGSLKSDIKDENGHPDTLVYLFDINAAGILDSCNNVLDASDVDELPQWSLDGSISSNTEKNYNCCSIVLKLIRENLNGKMLEQSRGNNSLSQMLAKLSNCVEPNTLAQFFKYLTEYEKKLTQEFKDVENSIISEIENKFFMLADEMIKNHGTSRIARGNNLQYERHFPEIYESVCDKIRDKIKKSQIDKQSNNKKKKMVTGLLGTLGLFALCPPGVAVGGLLIGVGSACMIKSCRTKKTNN